MLQFEQLSYWEKSAVTENIDFLVIGAGIVGSACALELRRLHPKAKIVIIERGYLPSGASTKNAGFACFGSVSELADDLLKMPAEEVWKTVALRWRGLKRLQERFGAEKIGLSFRGSWDLMDSKDQSEQFMEKLPDLNQKTEEITGFRDCFSYDGSIAKTCGFKNIEGGFYNRLEGELHTGKLFTETQKLLAGAEIATLYGISVLHIESVAGGAIVYTGNGELKAAKVAVTVNGFASELLGDKRIQPARAQVLVTEKIEGFGLPGTFHYREGYYYFRAVDNRLLIGGGRNLDFTGETTTDLTNSSLITDALKQLISEKILPGKDVRIDYQWAGIMGVGDVKKPIIELISPSVGAAVRMGGMGVAIGSLAGEELAGLLS